MAGALATVEKLVTQTGYWAFKHKTLRAAWQFLAENPNLTSLCRQML
jgi:hypothetical protein